MNRLILLKNRVISFFNEVNVQRAAALILAAFAFLLTVAPQQARAAQSAAAIQEKAENILQDDDSNRPKTTRQWNQEARETEGKPLERTKRIVNETADAVEDWAELYPDVAERSIPALQDDDA
jgi:hypothetical protein